MPDQRTIFVPYSVGDYIIMAITEYDVSGRPFYYVLDVHPDMIGAVTSLHFYDGDGDGKFESVEHRGGNLLFVPDAPAWLQSN